MAKHYYSLEQIEQANADFYVIFGKKGNGKTTACLEKCLKRYIETGDQFVWMRRWNDDFMGSRAKNFFSAIVARGVVEELTDGKWNNIVYYQKAWYLSKEDGKGKTIKDSRPCGFAYAMNAYEHNNGVNYPDVHILVFDEFITEDELSDEFHLFTKCYSNVRRDKTDFVCYMLGNTVSYFSSYWAGMGIGDVRKMDVGTIKVFHGYWKSKSITIACEFCGLDSDNEEDVDDSEVPIKVFEQYDAGLSMITTGNWETAEYAQPPEAAHRKWNVKYRCFLEFYEYVFAIDLIKDGKNIYLFIHPHTSEIPEKSVVYNIDTLPDRFHKYSILLPDNDVEKLIKDLIIHKKVFYADNEVGNVFKVYLNRL